MSEIRWACQNGEVEKIQKYLDGGDANKEIDGRRLIHMAADYGQLEVIQELVGKGADINAVDKHGISVILAAIWEGHTSCVKYLLSKGAKTSGKAPDGKSYIECAEKDEIKELLK